MEGFGGHLGRGDASEPSYHIHRPAEVPPTGVGLHTMRHPGNLYGLPRLEDALQYIFFLSLFQGGKAQIPGREITGLPIRKDGIALPNSNWTASCVITGHLILALHRMSKFRSGDHATLMRDGRDKIQQRHAEEAENALGESRAAEIGSGCTTAGADSADRGVALGAPLNRQSLIHLT